MIDFEPSEEQALVIETVRQFAEHEIRPQARESSESRKLPGAVLDKAHELGLVANAIEEAHGGGGERSALTAALVAEELAFGDLAIALAILSPSLVALPVSDFGSDAQKGALLPTFVGERFVPGSLAIVEPSIRFDPLRPATQARREGGSYRLSGSKCFVPWLDGGGKLLVTATDGDDAQVFVVDHDAAGLTATPEKNMGVDALPTVELALDAVAAERLGGDAGASVREIVTRGRVGLAAMGVGVANAAFRVARDYAKQREAFGGPIAAKQAIAFKLADMAIEIDGARLLVWEAAWKLDQGEDASREATLAYTQVQKVALEVADGAVQVFGGHGYIREYLPELHLRNARGFASFEAMTIV